MKTWLPYLRHLLQLIAGALVARAMLDQGGLGQRVGRQMAGQVRVSPDLRRAIDIVDSIATPSSPPSSPPSTPASR